MVDQERSYKLKAHQDGCNKKENKNRGYCVAGRHRGRRSTSIELPIQEALMKGLPGWVERVRGAGHQHLRLSN